MEVRDLGEFGLIDRLAKLLGRPNDDRLIVGIGDDAAVWRTGDNGYVIATTDTLVENVHFLPGRVPWRDVGWKALAVNVSDIAAMGGTPTFALVTLTLPPEMPVEHLDALYEGLAGLRRRLQHRRRRRRHRLRRRPSRSLLRSRATPSVAQDGGPLLLRAHRRDAGDLIAVTGPLGGARGQACARCSSSKEKQHPSLVESHLQFWPRVDAGKIAVAAGIRCGIDISDGLVQDLGHICKASDTSARLHARPRSRSTTTLRIAIPPDDAAMMAATGGEDYELLLVGGKDALEMRGSGAPQAPRDCRTPNS